MLRSLQISFSAFYYEYTPWHDKIRFLFSESEQLNYSRFLFWSFGECWYRLALLLKPKDDLHLKVAITFFVYLIQRYRRKNESGKALFTRVTHFFPAGFIYRGTRGAGPHRFTTMVLSHVQHNLGFTGSNPVHVYTLTY